MRWSIIYLGGIQKVNKNLALGRIYYRQFRTHCSWSWTETFSSDVALNFRNLNNLESRWEWVPWHKLFSQCAKLFYFFHANLFTLSILTYKIPGYKMVTDFYDSSTPIQISKWRKCILMGCKAMWVGKMDWSKAFHLYC